MASSSEYSTQHKYYGITEVIEPFSAGLPVVLCSDCIVKDGFLNSTFNLTLAAFQVKTFEADLTILIMCLTLLCLVVQTKYIILKPTSCFIKPLGSLGRRWDAKPLFHHKTMAISAINTIPSM
jgi:hypothetical protein